MDRRAEISEFLRSRRAALSPAEVGLPAGTRRRVAGLRRGEVAELAGVSVEYFARLERGEVDGVSAAVVDALGRALRLDTDEHSHLRALVRAVGEARTAHPQLAVPPVVRPGLLRTVDALAVPALLVNAMTDVLHANVSARALYADLLGASGGRASGTRGVPNYAGFVFDTREARAFYEDWETAADEIVATLHHATARRPHDAGLVALVGRLRESSPEFARRWSAQTVARRSSGVKVLRHWRVGPLRVSYETLELPDDAGLALMVYTATPGSASSRALDLLAPGGDVVTPGGPQLTA